MKCRLCWVSGDTVLRNVRSSLAPNICGFDGISIPSEGRPRLFMTWLCVYLKQRGMQKKHVFMTGNPIQWMIELACPHVKGLKHTFGMRSKLFRNNYRSYMQTQGLSRWETFSWMKQFPNRWILADSECASQCFESNSEVEQGWIHERECWYSDWCICHGIWWAFRI